MVARPFLLRAQGRHEVLPRPLRVPAAFAWTERNPRRQYLRARLETFAGEPHVVPHPRQGSAMLTAACWADGLAVVDCGRTVARGEYVDFLPFDALLG
ncbi:hypothetical protein D9M69_287630 [compost metagenome]